MEGALEASCPGWHASPSVDKLPVPLVAFCRRHMMGLLCSSMKVATREQEGSATSTSIMTGMRTMRDVGHARSYRSIFYVNSI